MRALSIIAMQHFVQFANWMSNRYRLHSSLDCGSGTFAFSSSCAKDSYHRPTAGYINICAEVCMHTCAGMQSMCAQQFATLRLVATVMESLTRGRPVGGGTKSDQRPRPPSYLAGCHQSPL